MPMNLNSNNPMKYLQKKFFLVLGAIAFLPLTAAANCWDVTEVAKIADAELDDQILFSVKDAKTCDAVSNYKILLGNQAYKSDSKGYVRIDNDVLSDMEDGSIPIAISADGYITMKMQVTFSFGIPRLSRFLLSPKMPPGSARFVLQWGEWPKDLDLHLKSDDFHVSYRNKRNIPGKAALDRDDKDGFGPETITLEKISVGETYTVFVDNYSEEKPFASDGIVQIYIDNVHVKTFEIPAGGKEDIVAAQIAAQKLVK